MAVVTLFVVATATFFLMHAVPGDPLRQEKAMSDAIRANLEERYGLNKPLHEQYTRYMGQMFLHGDFGISFKQANRRVNDIIADHFVPSATVLYLIAGVALGLVGAFLSVPKLRRWLATAVRPRLKEVTNDLVELAKLNKCSTANFVQHIIRNHLQDLYENTTRHEH